MTIAEVLASQRPASATAPGTVLTRGVLDRISRTKDGKSAAANTANRKRMCLNSAMEYAVEIGALSANPLRSVNCRTGGASSASACSSTGPSLVSVRSDRLPRCPCRRTGSRRSATHPPWEIRDYPEALGHERAHPGRTFDRNHLLRDHLKAYGTGPDGRVFVGPRGGILTDRAYLKVFHEARKKAFTEVEAKSPLMDVPYALRHAAVSTWLRIAGDPAQVAEWAGHSVAVLLRVYTKCIHGMEQEALKRIWEATRG